MSRSEDMGPRDQFKVRIGSKCLHQPVQLLRLIPPSIFLSFLFWSVHGKVHLATHLARLYNEVITGNLLKGSSSKVLKQRTSREQTVQKSRLRVAWLTQALECTSPPLIHPHGKRCSQVRWAALACRHFCGLQAKGCGFSGSGARYKLPEVGCGGVDKPIQVKFPRYALAYQEEYHFFPGQA